MGSFHRWRNLGMLLKAVKMGRTSQGSGTFLKGGAVRGGSRYLANVCRGNILRRPQPPKLPSGTLTAGGFEDS